MKKNIYLIGPMGAGKTTIGRTLADALGYEFFDSDKVIVDRAGADIPWIFDIEGEEGFRDRESMVLDELTQLTEVVVATGGGIITRESNRKLLRKRGLVVYLETSIRQQLFRTEKDRNRPLLLKGDRKKILTDLMDVRGPLYEDTADVVVPTDKSPKAITRKIIEAMESQQWEQQ